MLKDDDIVYAIQCSHGVSCALTLEEAAENCKQFFIDWVGDPRREKAKLLACQQTIIRGRWSIVREIVGA